MLPTIWIFDTYSIMLFIGVISCLYLFSKYFKKIKEDEKYINSIEIIAVISVLLGIVSATLFQSLFDAFKKDSSNSFFSMTFFGGLIGGVLCFLLLYFLYIKKKYPSANFNKILIIAPSCITLAHGFGRIGCFLAGCCYGIETNSIFGVKFPFLDYKVYPTQLFEAAFLFILTIILAILAFKYNFIYTFVVYLFSYGTFRFFIEFIRGDDRGAYFLSLSPSQWLSIVCIIIAMVLLFYFKKRRKLNLNK